MISKNDLLEEMLLRKRIGSILQYKDFLRLVKRIDSSIFTNKCCLYQTKQVLGGQYFLGFFISPETRNTGKGYIPKIKKNNKKHLIRLIYDAYYPLNEHDMVKSICKNPYCICLNHIRVIHSEYVISPKENSFDKFILENSNKSLTVNFD